MKKRDILAAAGALLIAGSASADDFLFQALLDGLQEVPPNESRGTGTVDLLYDDVTMMLSITSGSYMDLMGTVIGAHVHIAPVGVNGPVIIPLTHTGGMAGTLSGSGVLTEAQETALFADGLYINVHTDLFPGGEIRGQLFLVPAPGAFALLGVAGLTTTTRRRRG
ncbi:MAG: CHRD domain-containing protein [Phycisphaerales bacterium]